MFGYCATVSQRYRTDDSWKGHWKFYPIKISIKKPVCFQYYLKQQSQRKRRNQPILTSKLCKQRVNQCEKNFGEYKTKMDDWKSLVVEAVGSEPASEFIYWNHSLFNLAQKDLPKAREKAIKIIEDYYIQQIENGKQLAQKAKQFYQEKAEELANVEESLAESRKSAQKSMEEHWEVFRNEEWAILNSPPLLKRILSFLTSNTVVAMMLTCSRVLHFVRSQVPVNIMANNLCNATFYNWLSTFSHIHSLNCQSYTNDLKPSLYQKLGVLVKNIHITSLCLSQSAALKPANFTKFQNSIQKHQKALINLTIDAAMIPCFLNVAQLGKLQSLTLHHLNKDNENSTSWVAAFPKLTSLQFLSITTYNYSLENVSIPASTRKFYLSTSSFLIKDGVKEYLPLVLLHRHLPDVQTCSKLEELWVNEINNLSSLSALPNKLKVLKITGRVRLVLPSSLHAGRLELSDARLPLLRNIHARELVLSSRIDSDDVKRLLSYRLNGELSVVCFADPDPLTPMASIVEWEHILPKETKLIFLQSTMECDPNNRSHHRLYSLLLKYALIEYGKHHARCFIAGRPIAEAPDKWFHRDAMMCSVCGCPLKELMKIPLCRDCRQNYAVVDEEQNRIDHIRKIHDLFRGIKKRKRDEADEEPPLKKTKTSDE